MEDDTTKPAEEDTQEQLLSELVLKLEHRVVTLESALAEVPALHKRVADLEHQVATLEAALESAGSFLGPFVSCLADGQSVAAAAGVAIQSLQVADEDADEDAES